jgi:hypothetical protein
MEYEIFKGSNGWLVEAINFEGEGEIYPAMFYGIDAEKRAKEYADFMNGNLGDRVVDAS